MLVLVAVVVMVANRARTRLLVFTCIQRPLPLFPYVPPSTNPLLCSLVFSCVLLCRFLLLPSSALFSRILTVTTDGDPYSPDSSISMRPKEQRDDTVKEAVKEAVKEEEESAKEKVGLGPLEKEPSQPSSTSLPSSPHSLPSSPHRRTQSFAPPSSLPPSTSALPQESPPYLRRGFRSTPEIQNLLPPSPPPPPISPLPRPFPSSLRRSKTTHAGLNHLPSTPSTHHVDFLPVVNVCEFPKHSTHSGVRIKDLWWQSWEYEEFRERLRMGGGRETEGRGLGGIKEAPF